jgi:signal transduction histidine kinase/ligand-binding sensor domain-containing protein/DNA-binding response OmpR family regulator
MAAHTLSMDQSSNSCQGWRGWGMAMMCLISVGWFGIAFGNPLPPVNRFGISQGLSHNSVRSVIQDHHGFIWMGTYDGLNRYDGREFRIFRNRLNDTASLPHNYIYALHEDKSNNLWVGTGQGVVRYDPIRAAFVPLLIQPNYDKRPGRIPVSANAIQSDARGNLFIATIGWGFLWKQPEESFARQVPLITDNGKQFSFHVKSFCREGSQIWVFVQDVGLCRFDIRAGQLTPVQRDVRSANVILPDGRGHIWVGTDDGLHHYSTHTQKWDRHYSNANGALNAAEVLSLCYDRLGRLWIGTDGGGINILDTATERITRILPGRGRYQLSSESVYSIMADNESRMWIGLRKGGCNVLDEYKSPFRTVSAEPDQSGGLSSNFIYTFFEESDGDVMIGTDGSGLNIWNRTANTFRHFQHREGDRGSLSHNIVTSILKDAQGSYWVGTFGGGVNRFDRGSGRFQSFPCINERTGAEDKKISVLYEDRNREYWAATFSGGKLYRFDRSREQFVVFDHGLNDIISISEDSDGNLWAGNSNHLIQIDRSGKNHRFFQLGKPTRAIHEDKRGQCWIGTEGGGLVLFDRKSGKVIRRFSETEGLCNNSILNILEDDQGYLWLSTFNGLARFDPVRGEFRNFFESDGLQSNQFNYKAAAKLSDGQLLFGGINGFNIFDPSRVSVRNFSPPTHITNIQVNNRSIHEVSEYIGATEGGEITELRIPYAEAVLSFRFNALEYSSPEKIKYAFYLENWDKDWNQISNVRNINYNNIREGSYTLLIRNTNASGVWGKAEARLRIIILPPWYRSWWAICIYLALVAGALAWFVGYKSRQAQIRYKLRLSELDAEKEKEINERRQSFFTHITHEFRTPLTLIINPIKSLMQRDIEGVDRDELNFVYRNARRLLSLVDQLLLFRKTESETGAMNPVQIDLNELGHDVYLNFCQQAKARHMDYTFHCPGALPLIADREKLEIILFNLLSNAFKNTPDGGRITMTVLDSQGEVVVRVSDTGNGIAPEIGDRLFEKYYQAEKPGQGGRQGFGIGLYLVRRLMEEHGGAVSYTSEPGVGTEFRLRFPHRSADLNSFPTDRATGALDASFVSGIPDEDDSFVYMSSGVIGDVTDGHQVFTERPVVLIVDDNAQMRKYLIQVFQKDYRVFEAENGKDGLNIARQIQPDAIISDLVMDELSGIDFCKAVKESPVLSHIPFILITGSATPESKMQGIENGADDYIPKPFETDLLLARVHALLRKREELQRYFYSEITHQQHGLHISAEYKEFLDRCIEIVEAHLEDEDFNIQRLAGAIGMSHSRLYKKIKAISGQSANAFIRFIRLRKAAELFINTDLNIGQTAFRVGLNDVKYFRDQFTRTFGMKPSEYIKKYRKTLGKNYKLDGRVVRRGTS